MTKRDNVHIDEGIAKIMELFLRKFRETEEELTEVLGANDLVHVPEVFFEIDVSYAQEEWFKVGWWTGDWPEIIYGPDLDRYEDAKAKRAT